MSIRIVTAQREHIAGIYSLVEELAVYEKAREEMWMTLDGYYEAYDQVQFRSIVALSEDQEVVGTCIFYSAFSTWKGKMMYLEDFVVSESHRRHGLGQMLFDELIKICHKEDFKLLKWQVLDWNETAVNFYKKNNAIIEKEWWNGKIIF